LGVTVRPVSEADRAWLEPAIRAAWGSDRLVSRGRLVEPVSVLPGFAAELDGEPVGYALVRIEGEEVEVAVIEALVEGRGVGSALLAAVETHTVELGLRRAWLVTTNDNLRAIGFYQRRGWGWVAFHREAVTEGRRLKPEISEVGENGIEIRHELEFEWRPESL
jgi:ribosomal protein S18 acetylase RimI-like enzyme